MIRSPDLLSAATRQLYEAELALHDARTSHVDTWISAAACHLHDALQHYLVVRDCFAATNHASSRKESRSPSSNGEKN